MRGRLSALAKGAWNSPTLTTWASQFARVGTLLLVLPLILNRFSPAEVAVWYLFAGVISLSDMADFGFRSTFVRVIAFAAGGAENIGVMKHTAPRGTSEVNWPLVEKLMSAMRRVYSTTTFLVAVALIVLGSIALWKPITQLERPGEAWLAWAIIVAATLVEFPGKIYKNYLEGMFLIAMVRRVETVFRVASILSAVAVMTWAPGLLSLTAVSAFWIVANVVRDRYLARAVHDRRFATFRRVEVDRAFLGQLWSPAWRSGISTLMSKGFLGMTGILYAQIGSAAAVASYLLALKLITAVRDVCNAPFYSKIPLFGRLRAAGDSAALIRVARRGMTLANLTFVGGVATVGILAEPLLRLVGSNTPFVPLDLWWLMGLGFFGHRISEFFIQLYQTTNHIIAHIVNALTGLVFALAVTLLIRPYAVYAFPLSMMIAFLGLHTAISAWYASLSLPLTRRAFARDFLAMPAGMVGVLLALLVAA